MHMNRIILLAAAMLLLSSCATREYVDQQIASMEARQNAQIQQLTSTARQALERATDAGMLAEGKFLYTVVYTDADGLVFDRNSSVLSSGVEAQLTELANTLKAENENVYLEIQGHTDATGTAEYNHWLGERRAESVRRYLHSQGVALDRMATISYGEDEPVASNDTSDGRALNRRVEIVVLR